MPVAENFNYRIKRVPVHSLDMLVKIKIKVDGSDN